jgi:hypothetical protein
MSRNSTAGHVPLELAEWRGECAYVFPPTFTTSSPGKSQFPKSRLIRTWHEPRLLGVVGTGDGYLPSGLQYVVLAAGFAENSWR